MDVLKLYNSYQETLFFNKCAHGYLTTDDYKKEMLKLYVANSSYLTPIKKELLKAIISSVNIY